MGAARQWTKQAADAYMPTRSTVWLNPDCVRDIIILMGAFAKNATRESGQVSPCRPAWRGRAA